MYSKWTEPKSLLYSALQLLINAVNGSTDHVVKLYAQLTICTMHMFGQLFTVV